jgi:hypothetical protein
MNEIIGVVGAIAAIAILYWSLNKKYDFEREK